MHRDLKLSNILLDKNGFIKVCDYGLSMKLNPGEYENSYCGTVTTMAP